MSRNENLSQSISKYKELLDKDSKSKAFAPLAELYRKAGYVDEALRTLKHGLKYNPSYVLGYLVLANCYYDLGQYNLSYDTIHPFVEIHRENLQLQRTFGLVCKQLNKLDEALIAFKHLLFLNPKDHEVAQKIREIEEQVNPMQDFLVTDFMQTQKIMTAPREEFEIEGWEQLNFFSKSSTPLIENVETVKEAIQSQSTINEEPLNTVSIAQLYVNQGYIEKAEEVIKKILELRPLDPEGKRLKNLIESKKLADSREDLGRKNLMDIIDEKVLEKKSYNPTVLEKFLEQVKQKAQEKRT
jgi:tetratricopeptide (TPR) repeat protein